MKNIKVINLSLQDYYQILENENYYFRKNYGSTMYLIDNKIYKLLPYQQFSVDNAIIDYREELEKLNVNIPKF